MASGFISSTLDRVQRAVKLDEKAVRDRFNLGALEAGKNFTQ
jgi:hypothetical protein